MRRNLVFVFLALVLAALLALAENRDGQEGDRAHQALPGGGWQRCDCGQFVKLGN